MNIQLQETFMFIVLFYNNYNFKHLNMQRFLSDVDFIRISQQLHEFEFLSKKFLIKKQYKLIIALQDL